MRRAILLALIASFLLIPRMLTADQHVPRLDHVFVIIEENQDYAAIIGNTTDAPHLNTLANTYGLATDYFGIAHPSEPNYVAFGGGNYYGIQDDNDYTCPNAPSPNTTGCSISSGTNYPNHTIYGENLAQQFDDAHLSWRGYFQSLPFDGYTGDCYPSATASPSDCLYAAKHNPFINFDSVQDHDLNKMVTGDRLATDLQSDRVPNLSVIVPDQCHDMHGQGACTGLSGTGTCNQDCLIATGDTFAQNLVTEIMGSNVWKHGHNAIVITWDEADPGPGESSSAPGLNTGCCDAGTSTGGGGGRIPTIVISNEPQSHHLEDATPYNHYSLLRTIEDSFGLGCVQNSCDSKNVVPLTPLLTGH